MVGHWWGWKTVRRWDDFSQTSDWKNVKQWEIRKYDDSRKTMGKLNYFFFVDDDDDDNDDDNDDDDDSGW